MPTPYEMQARIASGLSAVDDAIPSVASNPALASFVANVGSDASAVGDAASAVGGALLDAGKGVARVATSPALAPVIYGPAGPVAAGINYVADRAGIRDPLLTDEQKAERAQNQAVAAIMSDANLSEEEKRARVAEVRAGPKAAGTTTDAAALTTGGFDAPMPAARGGAPGIGMSDFGMASAQRGIREAGENFQTGLRNVQSQQDTLIKKRQGTLDEEKALAMDRAQQEAQIMESRYQKAQEIAGREAELERRKQEQVAKDMRSLGEARENLRYFNMDPAVRKRAQDTLADTTATEQEKAKAREALDRGSKIDPGRLLGSARNKVMASIAHAFGTYASAFGVQNTASQLVMDAIDSDIMAQREAAESRRGDVSVAQGLLETNRRQFEDDRQALIATKIQMLELSQLEMDRARSRYAGAEQVIGLDKAQQELEQHKVNLLSQFNEASANNAIRTKTAEATIASQRAQTQAAQVTAAAKARETGRATSVPGLKPLDGYQPSEKDADQAKKIASAGSSLRNAVRRLMDVRDRAGAGGFEVLDRSLVNEGKTALADAVTAYKDAKELGALDKGSLQLAEDALGGDPTGVGPKDARYGALLKAIDSDMLGKLKPYGFTMDGGVSAVPGIQPGRAR